MTRAEHGGSRPEHQEASAEKALNEYGAQMNQALADLVVSKAGSEEDLREAFADTLVMNRCFDNVISDVKGNLVLDAVQGIMDHLVAKYDLEADKFSVHRLQELIKDVD